MPMMAQRLRRERRYPLPPPPLRALAHREQKQIAPPQREQPRVGPEDPAAAAADATVVGAGAPHQRERGTRLPTGVAASTAAAAEGAAGRLGQ